MHVTGSNNYNQPQYNSSFNCAACAPCVQQQQNNPPVQNNQQQAQCCSSQPAQPAATSVPSQPQLQMIPPQTLQIPSSTSGVNIQIINPTVAAPGATGQTYNVNQPCYYPAGYYTGQMGGNGSGTNVSGGNNGNNASDVNNTNNTNTTNSSDKKTEKKKVVELTDQYIMNLENYLNSQDSQIRRDAAKEVYARLEEDPSRKDDKALTALVNKMLQDPSEEVRLIALAALDGRYCLGDDYTVGVLQNMQKTNGGYGQDAVDAANILLKMSGRQVEKEIEVDPTRQRKVTKTEEKKTTKTKKG